jgi:hypothetical protein
LAETEKLNQTETLTETENLRSHIITFKECIVKWFYVLPKFQRLFFTIIDLIKDLPGGNVANGHGHVGRHDKEVTSELSLHTLDLRNQHDIGRCQPRA